MDQLQNIKDLISRFVGDQANSSESVRDGLEEIISDCEARLIAMNDDE